MYKTTSISVFDGDGIIRPESLHFKIKYVNYLVLHYHKILINCLYNDLEWKPGCACIIMNFARDFLMMTQHSLFAITCKRAFPMTAYTTWKSLWLNYTTWNSPYTTANTMGITHTVLSMTVTSYTKYRQVALCDMLTMDYWLSMTVTSYAKSR